MKKAVIALKAGKTKAEQKELAYQAGRLSTVCTAKDVQIIDCILTYAGLRDIQKSALKIKEKNEFDYLVFYSGKDFTDDRDKWLLFIEELKKDGIVVVQEQ